MATNFNDEPIASWPRRHPILLVFNINNTTTANQCERWTLVFICAYLATSWCLVTGLKKYSSCPNIWCRLNTNPGGWLLGDFGLLCVQIFNQLCINTAADSIAGHMSALIKGIDKPGNLTRPNWGHANKKKRKMHFSIINLRGGWTGELRKLLATD